MNKATKRAELLRSPHYRATGMKLDLFRALTRERDDRGAGITLERINEIAEEAEVPAGLVVDALNGDYEGGLTDLCAVAMACGVLPQLTFVSLGEDVAGDGAKQVAARQRSARGPGGPIYVTDVAGMPSVKKREVLGVLRERGFAVDHVDFPCLAINVTKRLAWGVNRAEAEKMQTTVKPLTANQVMQVLKRIASTPPESVSNGEATEIHLYTCVSGASRTSLLDTAIANGYTVSPIREDDDVCVSTRDKRIYGLPEDSDSSDKGIDCDYFQFVPPAHLLQVVSR